MGLGDAVEKALSSVGITKERVTRWLGKPCGCEERKAKLNRLGWWAQRVLLGKTNYAREFIDGIMLEVENNAGIQMGSPTSGLSK